MNIILKQQESIVTSLCVYLRARDFSTLHILAEFIRLIRVPSKFHPRSISARRKPAECSDAGLVSEAPVARNSKAVAHNSEEVAHNSEAVVRGDIRRVISR